MCGVDLTRIDVTTTLVAVSEVGTDMGRFKTDKHFASWLGLCPGTKITGGKVMSGKTQRCANRAAQARRLAAAALRSSQSALGAYYRRMCARMDKPKAVTAAAHKLARLIYAMLTNGQEYNDRGRTTLRNAIASGSYTTSRRRLKPWVCNSCPAKTPLENTMKINQLSGVS